MYCGFWRYKISKAYKYVDKKAVIRREMRIVGKTACGVVQFLIALLLCVIFHAVGEFECERTTLTDFNSALNLSWLNFRHPPDLSGLQSAKDFFGYVFFGFGLLKQSRWFVIGCER